MKHSPRPVNFILASTFLFGLSPPIAKLLVADISPVALAALLYLGAFSSLGIYALTERARRKSRPQTQRLRGRDFLWLGGATLAGGVVAPVAMMLGLTQTSGFTASLMLNLEGVATAAMAVILFKENAGPRLWLALLCMTAAGVFLSWDPGAGKVNAGGPLLLLLAAAGWGLDNNLTRHIADKNPVTIAMVKGMVAGSISLGISFLIGSPPPLEGNSLLALLLGSLSYGLSLVFFIRALQGMGAARSGLFYSFAPFVGGLLSIILLLEWLGWVMLPATIFMVLGLWLVLSERHDHAHHHHAMLHTHAHDHTEIHHQHAHTGFKPSQHTHEHAHPEQEHEHPHWPDTHHRHSHHH
jgi:drug/metabolite transporter (DMT)-like permease